MKKVKLSVRSRWSFPYSIVWLGNELILKDCYGRKTGTISITLTVININFTVTFITN